MGIRGSSHIQRLCRGTGPYKGFVGVQGKRRLIAGRGYGPRAMPRPEKRSTERRESASACTRSNIRYVSTGQRVGGP
eukprot:3197440-Rhodomonas_salina.1